MCFGIDDRGAHNKEAAHIPTVQRTMSFSPLYGSFEFYNDEHKTDDTYIERVLT